MKKYWNTRKALCLLPAAAIMFAACSSDKDLYEPTLVEKQAKEEFSANFIQKFGAIDKNQSWDLYGSPVAYLDGALTRAGGGASQVKAQASTDYPFYTDGWYEMPAATYTTVNKLQENVNNANLGFSYAMLTPDNSFSIIPLRQGYTNSPWELHMVAGTGADAVDYLLFSKNEDYIQYKTKATGSWTKLGSNVGAVTYNKNAIRSKVYSFDMLPEGTPIYFYLYRPNAGTYPSSLEGFMLDFTDIVTLPEDLVNAGKSVKVLGLEGQYDTNISDFDYEDVMFLIVGDPKLPTDVTPTPEDKTITFKQDVSKRYMIEDLGNTYDTDYNDIVVDVKATREVSYTLDANGQVSDKTYGSWENQQATLRHLGGVLDFQLTIGGTTLKWMEGKMGANPDETFDITGWNPDANNISICVKQKEGNGINSIDFPRTGAVPLIIATSTEQKWMDENVSIIDTLKQLIINLKDE